MNVARFYLITLCSLVVFLFGFSHGEKTMKATWIWQAELIKTQEEEILSFAKKNQINLLYLRLDLEKPVGYYRSFVKHAHEAGIEVHALGGHPRWALKADQNRIMKLITYVKKYNASVTEEEQMKGIHLDIEPYLLDEWSEDRDSVLTQWIGNIDRFVQETKKNSDLEVSADLAVWFDDIDITVPDEPDTTISKRMMEKLDHVTLMAYRDTVEGSNGIASMVKNEMKEADELDKPVLIAVNTKEMPGERHTSFFEEGQKELNHQLSLLTEKLGSHSSYAGVAIHDYKHWRRSEEKEVPGQPEEQPAEKPQGILKGTYIWEAERAISEQDEILDFAKENGLNLLYVRLDLQKPHDVYSEFVEKAHASGIEVHAMGGHPIWVLEKNRNRMMKLVKYVKSYNKDVAKEQQFDGIHLDIEPYVLPQWREDQDGMMKQWMNNIEAFVEETKRDSNLETSVDLAVWLDRYRVPGDADTSFSKWMISELDHVTLMAFRDKAEGSGGIAAVVKDEMRFADELGKKLIIAVEMKESPEGNHITFYEEGKAEMKRQLALLPKLLGDHSSFAGHAVHAYDYWKDGRE